MTSRAVPRATPHPLVANPSPSPHRSLAADLVARLGFIACLGLAACSGPGTSPRSQPDSQPDATTQKNRIALKDLTTPGIARELAQTRAAAIRNVRYELAFRMQPGMTDVSGEATIEFDLDSKAHVILDFDGEDLQDVRINGAHGDYEIANNHIVIAETQVRPGTNTVQARFKSKVAATGTPLTVYKDKTDRSEYYYTLVVPADAHRLFPCFDQPDLKGEFSLAIEAPTGWHVIANGRRESAPTASPEADDALVHRFETTRPLSTYLFAFAAGPFAKIDRPETPSPPGSRPADSKASRVPMQLFMRKSKVAKAETDLIFKMHDDAVRWLGDYFRYPYPFSKLDMVLLPGFPYGGMEHAGAIFYRETSLVFDQDPTEGELTRRSTLIYHEVSHQWFGNLVTMRWFDDLWLKEGFATFMGYTLFEALEPGKHAWLRFHHRVKPRAYAVDGTSGTTPIYQELKNLADAKSAYGAIVYNKAPAILRELNHRLGPAKFQAGVQQFLAKHEFGNATWQDLVAALESAAQSSESLWSSRWILAPGMPRVQANWSATGGKIDDFVVRQGSARGDQESWPLRLEVLLIDPDGKHETIRVVSENAETSVDELAGRPAPACVLLNPRDIAYGQFLLDDKSQAWLVSNVHSIEDSLVRAVAMSALFETVREGQLDPSIFADVAMRLIRTEKDAGTHAWLLGTLSTSLRRYMPPEKSSPLLQRLSSILTEQLRSDVAAIKTQTLRFLMRTCSDESVLELCESVCAGKRPIAGLSIGKRDRFLAAAALLGVGRGRGPLQKLVAELGDEDVEREAYIAGAADPTAKQAYFEGYLNPEKPPEQWVSISLDNFHWPGQESVSLPYLRKALERVEWVKKNRKVFFMPAWIDAFVNGHSSPEALEVAKRFLDEYSPLSIDIRRKILQSLDSLERAVKIKERWK